MALGKGAPGVVSQAEGAILGLMRSFRVLNYCFVLFSE